MGLRVKFNVVLISCLLLGFIAIYWVHRSSTLLKAEMSLVDHAKVVFQTAESIRNYNEKEITPLLDELDRGFIPQTVGSYASTQVFSDLNKTLPSLSYKVAITDSPVSLYQPNIWQQNIINQFRNNPGLPAITEKMADAQGRFLVYAMPITSQNEATGAKIVRVDEKNVLAFVEKDLLTFALVLLGILVMIIIILNVMMHWLVLKPIHQMSVQAEKISQGQAETDELTVTGSDEISQIAKAFNRMQRSLKAAMSMLS